MPVAAPSTEVLEPLARRSAERIGRSLESKCATLSALQTDPGGGRSTRYSLVEPDD